MNQIEYSNLILKLNHYVIGEQIASGGQCEAFLAKDTISNQQVCILCSQYSLDSRAKFHQLCDGISNVCNFIQYISNPEIKSIGSTSQLALEVKTFISCHFFLLIQYVGSQNLLHVDDCQQLIQYIHQILVTVSNLHKQNLHHLDISPLNILVYQNKAFLIDFGSMINLLEKPVLFHFVTKKFADPDLQQHPEFADTYALGKVVEFLFEGCSVVHDFVQQACEFRQSIDILLQHQLFSSQLKMANRSKTWRAAEVVEDDDFQNVGSSFGDIQEDMSDLSYCYNSKSQI